MHFLILQTMVPGDDNNHTTANHGHDQPNRQKPAPQSRDDSKWTYTPHHQLGLLGLWDERGGTKEIQLGIWDNMHHPVNSSMHNGN